MVRFYLSQSKKLFWQMPYYSLSPPLVGGSKYKHTGHMIERSLSCDLLFNNIIIIIIAITITITIIVIVTVIVIVIICIPTFQQIWWWAISLGLILAFALRRLFVKLPAPNHLVIIIIIITLLIIIIVILIIVTMNCVIITILITNISVIKLSSS